MDQCHTYQFLGFLVEYGARVEKARPLPRKKIEFYGDSVTAGEVSEAQNYAGMPDPPSEGEYNNAYFSYAWATARRRSILSPREGSRCVMERDTMRMEHAAWKAALTGFIFQAKKVENPGGILQGIPHMWLSLRLGKMMPGRRIS